jgi:hypothetical protein
MDDITPPFGYGPVVPLQRDNRLVLPKPDHLPAFARTTNALPLTAGEYAAAARDYPIVFSSSDGKQFASVAIVGINNQENLFVDANGWVSGYYIPAYVRRHPLCMTEAQFQGSDQTQRIICAEKDAIRDEGDALFEANGEPTERWKNITAFLDLFEEELGRMNTLCSLLAHYKLLEPFELTAKLRTGEDIRLTGMYRVDEGKLELLSASDLRTLFKKGAMRQIYQHLNSLDNFQRLLDRKTDLAAPVDQPLPAAAGSAGA